MAWIFLGIAVFFAIVASVAAFVYWRAFVGAVDILASFMKGFNR